MNNVLVGDCFDSIFVDTDEAREHVTTIEERVNQYVDQEVIVEQRTLARHFAMI